ncbi:ABC transporter permease [Actinoplanes sp. CA-030573]|uniref:ABC transporter permease n=1 Tax=Actinoplanes sp. CA-030573 TaxID=3239898 RepID=UPI003D938D26
MAPPVSLGGVSLLGRQRGVPPVPASLLAVLTIAVISFAGPAVLGIDPNATDPANAFAPVSGQHWLGTDEIGRDLLVRMMAGGRLSLTVAFGSVAIAFVIGTAWGALAAARRGWVDELLMRTADIAMAVPQILFALVCVAAFGASLPSLIVITGLLLAPTSARMARSVVLQEMSMDYYAAAVAYGAGPVRRMLLEVLPNTTAALSSQAVINAASAMILEASLSFVGLGVQPPDMSWGVLLQQGYGYLYNSATYAAAPAVAIVVTVFLLNLSADRLGGATRRGVR